MARRLPAVLVLALAFASGWVWQPAALADTAQARAPIDLDARLKEVVANPSQAEDLFKIGRKVAAVCANCHGEGGNSVLPSVPNLAGQNPAYLLEQVRQFADGRRRYEFMEGMIRAMSNDEKIGSVLFYSAQKVTHKPATNQVLANRGQAIFEKNCFRCHGTDGRGSDVVARIAGQQDEYLRTTLRRYRDGVNVRANSIMTPNARNLTDADIEGLVAYVSTMP